MTDPTPAAAPQPSAPFTAAEDKQYSTLATFLNIILLIPALIFYFAFGNRGPMIGRQSKENLNWTINISVIVIAAEILSVIFAFIPIVGFIISLLLGLVIWAALIVNLIFSIIGGTKVNAGEFYKYPFAFRFIK
ncbi:MAG: uncharacterized protein QOK08_309 [Actinomycetota bacterium]|jgi:uncharacterized Tic20 family protein|nr:uncharacterized protein [Actinomycetota bacterium]MDQ1563511.1 uncharacterized protein [Actinomycetota bacterium]